MTFDLKFWERKACKAKIGLEIYNDGDCDDWVLTVNGKPCGPTISESEATRYGQWLRKALPEIMEATIEAN